MSNIFGTHPITLAGIPHSAAELSSVQCDELVGVIFEADWDDKEEVSCMVEGTLTNDSKIEVITIDGDVNSELGGKGYENYKYLIQKQSGGKLTLKWDKFKTLIMKKMMSIKNIHEDYIIIMRKIVE